MNKIIICYEIYKNNINLSNNIMKSGKHLIGSTIAYLKIFLI
jgi:hypothetical protein